MKTFHRPPKSLAPIALLCAGVLTAWATAKAVSPDQFSTFAGGGPDHAPALTANVDYPVNVAVDNSGNFYFVGQYSNQQRVFKVSTSGLLTVVAGNGIPGFSGDGQLATLAELNQPRAIAVDASYNVYIADYGNHVIRKVSAGSGNISTVAGKPQLPGYSGDGGPATSAQLNSPEGIAVDGSGNLYIADTGNMRVRKIAGGIINTVAGNGVRGFSGDGGNGAAAELNNPESVAVDSAHSVYIADSGNYRIRKVSAGNGVINTVAGDGSAGYSGDGGAAINASISYPRGIASDASGRFFIADTSNCVVREVSTGGTITTVAGDHSCGFAGDSGTATSAELNQPWGVAVDSSNHLFIADAYNLRIRKVTLGGLIATVAGNGTLNYLGDGNPAEGALLNHPLSATADSAGNVYITDQSSCTVRKVGTNGIINTVAGITGSCGFSGDGGAATSARLYNPDKAVPDSFGNLYIADQSNCRIRKVSSSGTITTFAGSGACTFGGDGGPATAAQLNNPEGLTVDPSGNVYVADTYNHRIRKITASTSIISTIAGNGTIGFSGDGSNPITAVLNYPSDVAFDPISGNVYISDRNNHRIRLVHNGIITTFAGNGVAGYQGDGVPAAQTSLYYPSQVAVDVAGDLLISDYSNNRIRWVTINGLIHTVAGTGAYGFAGDGTYATDGEIANAWGVGVDNSGNIYVADTNNQRIRKITAIPNVGASTYSLAFPEQQVRTTSEPQPLVLRAVGPAVIYSVTPSGDFTEADDCPSALNSGSYCNVDSYFTPSKTGTSYGTLIVTTNSYFNPHVAVNLSGVGGGLIYSPGSTDFGRQPVSSRSAARYFTFTNSSTSALTFSSVYTTRSTFSIASNTCIGTLAAGARCTVGVTFAPSVTGLVTATLVAKDSDGSSPQLIPLRGTGLATNISPSSLPFGTVARGVTKSLSVTLSDKGTANLTSISASISGSNLADFHYTTTCSSSLAAGSSCSYTVSFRPSTTGAESARLSIVDSDGTFPVALTGTGH